MYFSFFKPQDWRKRSVVRGRGFIQRFHKDCRKKVSDIWPWNCNFRFMTDLPFSGREAVPSALYFLCRARQTRAADDHYTPFRAKSKTDPALFRMNAKD